MKAVKLVDVPNNDIEKSLLSRRTVPEHKDDPIPTVLVYTVSEGENCPYCDRLKAELQQYEQENLCHVEVRRLSREGRQRLYDLLRIREDRERRVPLAFMEGEIGAHNRMIPGGSVGASAYFHELFRVPV